MSAGKITSLVLATAACASLWTGYALDARRFTKTIGGLFAPIDEPDEASAAPVVNRPAAPTVATSSAATTTSSVSHAQLLSSPPGAIVVDLGDGHELGRTPLEVSLPIRTARAFEVRLIGFTPQKLTLAAPGAPVTVSLDRIGGAQNLGVQSAALTTQAKDKSDVLSAAAEDILTRTGGGDKVGLERMRATQAGLREELLGLGLTLPDLRSTAPDALNRWNRWLAAVETPTFDELNTTKTELTDAAKRMTITKPLLLQKLERGRAMLDRVSVSERDETHRMTSERVEAMVVEVTRAPTVDATTARAVSRLELDCFQLRSRTR